MARTAVAYERDGTTPLPLDVLGAALALALVDHGLDLVVTPGAGVRAVDDDVSIAALEVPESFAGDDAAGDEAAAGWTQFLAESGLEDLSLAAGVGVAPAGERGIGDAWPTLTVPATLSLRRTRALRRNTIVALAIAGPLGGAVCVAMIAAVVDAPTPQAQLFFALIAPVAVAMLAWWLGSRARVAFTSGSISITADQLQIDDRGLLREPLVIGRAQVRAVAVDDSDTRSVLGLPLRFAFGRSPWLHPSSTELAAAGWLWAGAHDDSVPMIGVGDEVPNLLLLFAAPLPVSPRMRRHGEGRPRRREPTTALALHVGDADVARDALAGWGVTRPLSDSDAQLAGQAPAAAAHEEPIAGSFKRAWALVALGLLVPPVALAALWTTATEWEHERRRAAILGLAAIAVFGTRLALYAGWL